MRRRYDADDVVKIRKIYSQGVIPANIALRVGLGVQTVRKIIAMYGMENGADSGLKNIGDTTICGGVYAGPSWSNFE